jgi:hypothetical protein
MILNKLLKTHIYEEISIIECLFIVSDFQNKKLKKFQQQLLIVLSALIRVVLVEA